MNLLEVKDLVVEAENKPILKKLNLKLELGKINVLMGPNGSGKTTLAKVLMGDPQYKIVSGKIMFNGKDINSLSPDKRAKLGIFLSFQEPISIEGVKILTFLRKSQESITGKQKYLLEFRKELRDTAKSLKIKEDFLEKYLNKKFSGGEKKKLEILQMLTLNPKLVILDEPDSGLDIDALKIVAKSIAKFRTKNNCILLITHYDRILKYIQPDNVFIVSEGKIALKGDSKLVKKLEKKGYAELLK